MATIIDNLRADHRITVLRDFIDTKGVAMRASKLAAQNMDGPDRLEAMENEMRRSIDRIGVAASIAEVYAQRMRLEGTSGR